MGISISKSIAAPPAEVFDRITDLHQAAERIEDIQQIEILTDGPIGVGTRFRETRLMFGKPCTEQMEITQFDAPHSYTVEAESCGARMISRFDVKAEGDGSRVVMNMESRPLTWMAKLMTPITSVVFSRMMKKCLEKDLDSIKANIENGAA
jgi:carbon monoxide dehydrogenase subunit G